MRGYLKNVLLFVKVVFWRIFIFPTRPDSPLEDVHRVVAEDAGHPVHPVGGVARQDEASRLVVPYRALVLHLGNYAKMRPQKY